MPKLLFSVRQPPATPLLLGLLALLLWGQCAFHLNENGSSKAPPPPSLHLKTAVRVVRLDSVGTQAPGLLYLTIALQNLSDKPCRLSSLNGVLWLDKHRMGYTLTQPAFGTVLPARGEQLFTVGFLPYHPTATYKGPGFGVLRTAWQQGRLPKHRAHLEVFYTYFPYQGTSEEANRRVQSLPLFR